MSKLKYFVLFLSIALGAGIAHADFSDIDRNSQYYTPTKFLQDRAVIQGYADGSYKPAQKVNRAEALKILYTAFKRDTSVTGRSPFPDVLSGAWYERFVLHAFSKKYIGGYPDGTFKPERTVNAVEMYKMLTNVGELPVPTLSAEIYGQYKVDRSAWYAPYLVFVLSKNLVDAFDGTSIEESHEMTRGEIALLVYRALYIQEKQLPAFPAFESGNISYYADELAGNKTANGDTYDPTRFTASHKTLPLGSWAHVFSEESRQGVVVKINDRGPYTEGGIADLSSTAFAALHSLSKGRFSGRLYQLPRDLNGTQKFYFSQTHIPKVELDETFPSMVMPGEIRRVEGKTNAAKIMIKAMLGGAEMYRTEVETKQGQFSTDVYFPREGKYTLEFYVDGVIQGSMHVVSVYMPSEGIGESHYAGAVTLKANADKTIDVLWGPATQSSVYKLILSQGSETRVFYVPLVTNVHLAGTQMTGFDVTQPIQLTFEVAHISTAFSHDLNTSYKQITTKVSNPIKADQLQKLNGSTASVEGDPVPNKDVERIVVLANADRALKGLPPLRYSKELSVLAMYKAGDMAKRDYFDHADPDGKYVNDWKGQFGYVPLVSENIGVANYFSAEDIYMGWHNSPGHYANIVDPAHELIGVGMAEAPGGKWYYVQHFSAEAVNGSSADYVAHLIEELAKQGLSLERDIALEKIAIKWAEYIGETGQLTFTIDGEGVFDVVRNEYGAGSFSAFAYQLGSMLEAAPAIFTDLSAVSGGKKVGIGIAQSKDGWINIGVLLKK